MATLLEPSPGGTATCVAAMPPAASAERVASSSRRSTVVSVTIAALAPGLSAATRWPSEERMPRPITMS